MKEGGYAVTGTGQYIGGGGDQSRPISIKLNDAARFPGRPPGPPLLYTMWLAEPFLVGKGGMYSIVGAALVGNSRAVALNFMSMGGRSIAPYGIIRYCASGNVLHDSGILLEQGRDHEWVAVCTVGNDRHFPIVPRVDKSERRWCAHAFAPPLHSRWG